MTSGTGMAAAWRRGQAAWLPGGSPRGAAHPCAGTLPACALPGSPCQDAARTSQPQRPGPRRRPGPASTTPHTQQRFPPGPRSPEPRNTPIPQKSSEGWGRLKAPVWIPPGWSGAPAAPAPSPVPLRLQPPRAPGWALWLRLAGWRLGEQVARSLPFPFQPARGCAWARKIKKQRTDLLAGLFRAGEAALVLPVRPRLPAGCWRAGRGASPAPH